MEKTRWVQLINILFSAIFFLAMLPVIKVGDISFEYYKEVFAFIVIGWVLLQRLLNKQSFVEITVLDGLVVLIIIYSLIHIAILSTTTIYNSLAWVFLCHVFILYLLQSALRNSTTSNYLLWVISFIMLHGGWQAVIALLQLSDLYPSENEFFKLTGFFHSPNFLGMLMGLCLMILVWYLFVSGISKPRYILPACWILAVLFFLVIVLSNSRITWITTLISISLLFINRSIYKKIAALSIGKKLLIGVTAILIVTAVAWLFYVLKPDSVLGRVLVYEITFQEILKRPLFGHGLFSWQGGYNLAKANYLLNADLPWNEIKNAGYAYTAFNDYLQIGYEFGLIGLIIILAILVTPLFYLKLNAESRLGISIFVSFATFALFNSMGLKIFLMLVALLGYSLILKHSRLPKIHFAVNNKKIKLATFLFCSFASCLIVSKWQAKKEFERLKSDATYYSHKKLYSIADKLDDNSYALFHVGKLFYQNGKKVVGFNLMERAYAKTYSHKPGKSLAFLYVQDGNYKRAEEIFRLNTYMEPIVFEHKMHLLKLYVKQKRCIKIMTLAKEIIDFPEKVPSKKVRNFKASAKYYLEKCEGISID